MSPRQKLRWGGGGVSLHTPAWGAESSLELLWGAKVSGVKVQPAQPPQQTGRGLWPCGYQHQVTTSVVAQMSKPWALIKLIPAPCFWGKGHHGEHPQAPSSEECRPFGAAWPPGRP